MPAHANAAASMSSSLEDYLETIYLLVQEQGFARVKDVARAREVKAASVSIALRRLADMALVRYERREYIALTPAGEEAGRKVFSRHRLLTRFFNEVLGMDPKAAAEQACAMEHSLTDEAMDRFVHFFESLGNCPNMAAGLRQCPLGSGKKSEKSRGGNPEKCAVCGKKGESKSMSLAEIGPGQTAIVTQIDATGPLRQRLLDMGLLPATSIDVERKGLGGDPLWVRCQGTRLALRRNEAHAVLVKLPV